MTRSDTNSLVNFNQIQCCAILIHYLGFQALSKIRKSLRDKKPPLGPLITKQNSFAGR